MPAASSCWPRSRYEQLAISNWRLALAAGQYVFAYGIFYPEGGDNKFEAKHLVFPGRKPGDYVFEKQDWWINQCRQLGDFYLRAQFEGGPVDYNNYRTNLTLEGNKLP